MRGFSRCCNFDNASFSSRRVTEPSLDPHATNTPVLSILMHWMGESETLTVRAGLVVLNSKSQMSSDPSALAACTRKGTRV